MASVKDKLWKKNAVDMLATDVYKGKCLSTHSVIKYKKPRNDNTRNKHENFYSHPWDEHDKPFRSLKEVQDFLDSLYRGALPAYRLAKRRRRD